MGLEVFLRILRKKPSLMRERERERERERGKVSLGGSSGRQTPSECWIITVTS
jgi:hypothetical protein